MNKTNYRLLFLSTPVGALGSGIGGGVELTLQNAAKALIAKGHEVEIVAPEGSATNVTKLTQIAGNMQTSAQTQVGADLVVLPQNSVLENMWSYARESQNQFDLLFNFAYDWLPLYLTPFFNRPIAHWISMSSLSPVMDAMVSKTSHLFPNAIAVNTRACADTFSDGDRLMIMGKGLDVSQYNFVKQPEKPSLAWVGRISPEKGLEDAAKAAQSTGLPLHVFGLIQDRAYWEQIKTFFSKAEIHYEGFLSTDELQKKLGQCSALLMTPRWVEAFGNAAIEAFACGVPVISYNSGGLKEIVRHGKTGFLVEMGSVSGLIEAISQLDQIDRFTCRQQLEAEYSLEVWGDRLEKWFDNLITNYSKPRF
ncbi:MAG: UDP-glucose--tetrahydrobiopterin glucosyltransferase [Pseudanabaena frigida]|uniref:UDP-glucose--tetrahydrobiopterin glucosyltransferase n=1 Tax=Pseudanabaena frigida TaxID=945775 RepID=A0A2W4WKW4_9CYAN|nr:MAG: UDP-glucose--tetrahydrobiopterin glucosyltransferase [Pseudanabaena frigida]